MSIKTSNISAAFMTSALKDNRASTATKTKMRTTFDAFARVAKVGRWGDVRPNTITEKQLIRYITTRASEGISERTLQNEASHLRRSITGAGRADFVDASCANAHIGVPVNVSRAGTGTVVDPAVLAAARSEARHDTRVLIDLEHTIGLRAREGVQSGPSISAWMKELAVGDIVTVRDGTKGGRARSVCLCPENAAGARVAVAEAIEILKTQDHFVESKNLKSALALHQSRCAAVGLVDENSQHSLRRDFAMIQFRYYKDELELSEKMALIRVSSDLGHGPTRGRWVMNNYLKPSL